MILFIVPTVDIMVIQLATECKLLKYTVGQKTVPMSDYFVQFIMSSVFIQIE